MGKPDVLQQLLRATVVDSQGKKVGKVREVYVDDDSKEPSFVEAFRGFLQMKSAFIPLLGYRLEGKTLTVNYPLDVIDSAPVEAIGKSLSTEYQNTLYTHYKVIAAEEAAPTTPAADDDVQAVEKTGSHKVELDTVDNEVN